jgi:8-oxo-dGTP pyrophosphatase MutT (NUDIX family)
MANFRQLIRLNEEKQEMGYGAGVCIFCPKTGRFLLQKRGPNIDDGEDILEGAVRELLEEGGIGAPPEHLYPLARLGYQPEKGLGGYFIWLLVVADEFDAIPNWDGDTHDEVEGFDWIGAKEWGNIKPHERVFVLFSDPTFVETLKKATKDRIDTDHVAKLKQGRGE